MKKLVLLIVLALAGCVAIIAITQGGAALAQPRFIDHYKCYQARHAKGSLRFTPQTVFLSDQFRESVQVSVLKLNTHCSLARQDFTPTADPSPPNTQQGLDCYAIRDAARQPRFAPRNIDVRDKLTNWDNQRLTVSKAQTLCVPSYKYLPKSTAEGDSFICYQAKRANVGPDGHPQPRFVQRNISIDDQFSNKLVRVIRPVALCTTAEKKIDAPNDDFECCDAELSDGDLTFEDHHSTVNSTLESNDPVVSCKDRYTNSVWYHWNSGQNLSLMIDTEGSSYNTVVAVFRGDKGPPWDEVSCLQNPTSDDPLQFDAWANTNYHILVGSSDGHGGKLKFRVDDKDDLGNANDCLSPITLDRLTYKGESLLEHVSTMNADSVDGVAVAGGGCNQNADPNLSCAGDYGASAWFSYTSTVAGNDQRVNFDATSSSYSTVIGVFDTSVNNFTEVACGASGFTAASLTANHKYLIVVGAAGGFNADGGKLKLNYDLKRQLINPPFDLSAGVTQQGTPDSITCYEVRQSRHRPENKDVWDQFSIRRLPPLNEDPWVLTIGGVDTVCVPSNKEPICAGASDDAVEPAGPC